MLLLKLELEVVKPLVIFGEEGVSRKGANESAASHYLTFPRLQATGSVKVGAQEHRVSGEAWMDHEFSSSQLDEGQAGWDWAAIQLKDGREIMVYRMRRTDGSTDAGASREQFTKRSELLQVGEPEEAGRGAMWCAEDGGGVGIGGSALSMPEAGDENPFGNRCR